MAGRRSMDAVAARAVRPLGLGLAAFYAALVAYGALALPEPPRGALLPVWASAATLLSLHALVVAMQPPAARHAHAHMVGQGLVAVGASLALLAATRDPSLAVALHLTAIGFGLVLLHAGAFAVVAAACAAGFLSVAGADLQAWSAQGIALVGSILAGGLANHVRRYTFRQHEARLAAESAAIHLEAEAARMRAEARFKSAFLGKAAHELQTPLTPLVLQAKMLRSRPPKDPEARRSADILVRNVERLSAVLQDFLVVQRFDSGAVQVQPVALDLAALAREAAAAAPAAAGRIQVAAPAPVPVRGDRDLLLAAVGKLLDNALKFAPPATAVALSVHADGPEAVVRVADRGPGVAAADRERLFRPFEQAHDPMQRTDSGFGLGLTVARLVAEAHGGRVGIGEGPGGVFELRLPLSA